MIYRLLATCCHVRPALAPTRAARFAHHAQAQAQAFAYAYAYASSTRFFSAAPSPWSRCEQVTVPCRSNGEVKLE